MVRGRWICGVFVVNLDLHSGWWVSRAMMNTLVIAR